MPIPLHNICKSPSNPATNTLATFYQQIINQAQNKYTTYMKIVFCGGGTAGHITPNLALIDLLPNEQNYYIGTNSMEKQLTLPYLQNNKIVEFCEITATKLQRKLTLKNLLIPFNLAESVKEAKYHLKRIAPNVVFSKGGYVGLPVTIAAKRLKIPVIIHESDMTVGLANKISAKFAKRFLSAYPCKQNTEVVGAIVRNVMHGDRKAGLQTMQLDGKKPVLLVMGGSLGAKALNDAICESKNLCEIFDIFVICGKGKSLKCPFVKQAEFATNMADIYAASSVCLTRGGSTSLAELALAQVPFVTVPLTKNSRGEQVKNSKWFAQHGCGIYLNETDLNEKLFDTLKFLYNNKSSFCNKQKKLTYLYGTQTVANIIQSYK